MPTNKHLTDLVINKVESQAVYDYMVTNNLINDDELYLVGGETPPATFYVIPGTTTIQELLDAYTAGTLCLVTKQDSEGKSRVLVLTSYYYIESTGVHCFNFSSVEGQNGILYYWTTFGTIDMATRDGSLTERPLQLDEEIFMVEYGVTAYNDIKNAISGGKFLVAPVGFQDGSVNHFTATTMDTDGTIYFYATYGQNTIIFFDVMADGTYHGIYQSVFETTKSKVTTIDSTNKNSTTQYPAVGAITTYVDSKTITAGNGLQGGGSLAANRTISVKAGTGITADANGVHNAGVRAITQDATDGHKLTVNTGGTSTTITIPDNNTTYTAGTALTLNGTEINHDNYVTAGTVQGNSGAVAYGGTITIPKVTYNAQGHITSTGTTTVTLPAAPSAITNDEIDTICGGTLDAYLESIAAEGVAF